MGNPSFGMAMIVGGEKVVTSIDVTASSEGRGFLYSSALAIIQV